MGQWSIMKFVEKQNISAFSKENIVENELLIRVMIVDDHEVVRRGLLFSLRTFKDLNIVGEASNGREAVQQCEKLQPDVVLMDMMMPEINGVEATRMIRQQWPQIQVVALTTFKDEELVREALKAGAIGYLLKDSSIEEVAAAIRTAMRGTLTLSADAAQALLQPAPAAAGLSYRLTEREIEVLGLMVEGLNNVEIAQRLVVSRSTVKFHVSAILSKLHVSSRVEAVTLALQNGLVK